MPRKAARALLRSRQRVNVDFYKVSDVAGGPAAFRRALQELIARRGNTRRINVRGERVDVHHIELNGRLIEGELGRLRSHDVPAIAAADCSTKDIDLAENESITERTAFLFDSRTGILALHTKREGMSASKIADLCDEVARNVEQFFVLEVQLTPDAEGKFERMSSYRNFRVRYSSAAVGAISRPDRTTGQFLQGMEDLGAGRLTVIASSDRPQESRLSFETVRRFLRKAESARDGSVEELKVSGRGAGDEKLVVDLIRDRMRDFRVIDVVGQSASYEQRRAVVKECYESKRQYFEG